MKKGIAGSSSVTGLGVAAMVVIGAISVNLKFKNEFGIAVFALVLACLTVLLVGGILYKERTSEEPLDPVYQLYLLSAFAVMWIVMACLVTFRGPFTVRSRFVLLGTICFVWLLLLLVARTLLCIILCFALLWGNVC
jgi:hypothetical protein